jgi:hypothetical protein
MNFWLKGNVTIPARPHTVGGLIGWSRGVNRSLTELRDRKIEGTATKGKSSSLPPVPLHILSKKPAYIAEPASPVTAPAKRYFIEWGTINEVVATNWDAEFNLSATRYFFAEITFAASDQLKVASWEIVTGAASDTHVTPDWDVGDPRPATMVILLGWVFVDGTAHTIAQSGGGSISVGEQITSITEGGAGETLIGKQLVYQRQNHE